MDRAEDLYEQALRNPCDLEKLVGYFTNRIPDGIHYRKRSLREMRDAGAPDILLENQARMIQGLETDFSAAMRDTTVHMMLQEMMTTTGNRTATMDQIAAFLRSKSDLDPAVYQEIMNAVMRYVVLEYTIPLEKTRHRVFALLEEHYDVNAPGLS